VSIFSVTVAVVGVLSSQPVVGEGGVVGAVTPTKTLDVGRSLKFGQTRPRGVDGDPLSGSARRLVVLWRQFVQDGD